MSKDDGGNIRLQDEKTGRFLSEHFQNICASHNDTNGGNVNYSGEIQVDYSDKLWKFLKDKQADGSFHLVGQFYYAHEPEVMEVTHLVLSEIERTTNKDREVIKIKLQSTFESRLKKIMGKHLSDVRLGQPFVFR